MRIGSHSSSLTPVTIGVPQGSVSSLLLFAIYSLYISYFSYFNFPTQLLNSSMQTTLDSTLLHLCTTLLLIMRAPQAVWRLFILGFVITVLLLILTSLILFFSACGRDATVTLPQHPSKSPAQLFHGESHKSAWSDAWQTYHTGRTSRRSVPSVLLAITFERYVKSGGDWRQKSSTPLPPRWSPHISTKPTRFSTAYQKANIKYMTADDIECCCPCCHWLQWPTSRRSLCNAAALDTCIKNCKPRFTYASLIPCTNSVILCVLDPPAYC